MHDSVVPYLPRCDRLGLQERRNRLLDPTAAGGRRGMAAGAPAGGRAAGRPSVEGRHFSAGWWHAVWRVGSRLIVVAQAENFESYCVYDAAALWVVEHPRDADIPTGDGVYALFFER